MLQKWHLISDNCTLHACHSQACQLCVYTIKSLPAWGIMTVCKVAASSVHIPFSLHV